MRLVDGGVVYQESPSVSRGEMRLCVWMYTVC